MVLRAGYIVVATKLQEASALLSDNDKRRRLEDTLQDMYRGSGKWAYLVDVVGSDVIYSCDGDLQKAPYTADTKTCTVDTAAAKDVFPFTTYVEELDEVAVGEAGARHSKSDMGHLQAIHDAATTLGASCKMSESGGKSTQEGAVSDQSKVSLIESAATLDPIVIREARADYEIKLIAPGKGSSAYYPADVLRRDGPKVFGAGTHVYLNHPTQAEEAARPEGDVKNLAGVLTTSAEYQESHTKGPGLYARMKVFADHGALVEEKAAHVGMSIRASGVAESGKVRDGVPVLKELTRAESVDVVTRAGAGGMILTESAKTGADQLMAIIGIPESLQKVTESFPKQESAMDETAVQKLIESAVKAAQAPLLERAIRGDAREAATAILSGITLHEAAKQMVIETVLRDLPQKDGALDTAKFSESVTAEAKRVAAVVAAASGAGRVIGMGTSTVAPKPEEIAAREAALKAQEASAVDSFLRIMGDPKAAAAAAQGRVA